MADGKTIKNYVVKVADGRMTISLKDKGADGRYHSASCECPLVVLEYNEETEKNEMVRKSRKQTENYLLSILGINA